MFPLPRYSVSPGRRNRSGTTYQHLRPDRRRTARMSSVVLPQRGRRTSSPRPVGRTRISSTDAPCTDPRYISADATWPASFWSLSEAVEVALEILRKRTLAETLGDLDRSYGASLFSAWDNSSINDWTLTGSMRDSYVTWYIRHVNVFQEKRHP